MFHDFKRNVSLQLVNDDLFTQKRLTMLQNKFSFRLKENAVKEA